MASKCTFIATLLNFGKSLIDYTRFWSFFSQTKYSRASPISAFGFRHLYPATFVDLFLWLCVCVCLHGWHGDLNPLPSAALIEYFTPLTTLSVFPAAYKSNWIRKKCLLCVHCAEFLVDCWSGYYSVSPNDYSSRDHHVVVTVYTKYRLRVYCNIVYSPSSSSNRVLRSWISKSTRNPGKKSITSS